MGVFLLSKARGGTVLCGFVFLLTVFMGRALPRGEVLCRRVKGMRIVMIHGKRVRLSGF
jgi:hypothetical protein